MKCFSKAVPFTLFFMLGSSAIAHDLNDYHHRPILTPSETQRVQSITYNDHRDAQGRYQSLTTGRCPLTEKWVQSILDRLVKAAALEDTSKLFPALSLNVGCTNLPLTETDIYYGKVQMSGDLILNATSEDEVAFVLAHELAHFTLGHDLMSILDQPIWDPLLENKADVVGLELTAKAGYDPGAPIHLLKTLRRINGNGDASDPHGTVASRIDRLTSEMDLHRYAAAESNQRSISPIIDELRKMPK